MLDCGALALGSPPSAGAVLKVDCVPDNAAKIAELRAILESGATSATVDGITVQYDLESIRRQLRALQLEDDAEKGKRPIAAAIDLTRF